jgi:hypothetical protein
MLPGKSWSPRQWRYQLDQVQITTSVLIEEIKSKLEQYLVSGNGAWIETYNCLGTLNRLESAIMSADLLRGLKVNPLGLLQEAVTQIQAFQEPSLEPFPLQLQLLSNDLERLIEYSLP